LELKDVLLAMEGPSPQGVEEEEEDGRNGARAN